MACNNWENVQSSRLVITQICKSTITCYEELGDEEEIRRTNRS